MWEEQFVQAKVYYIHFYGMKNSCNSIHCYGICQGNRDPL